ncbi:helix-turn-helix domain-containing protein [Clostridium sp. HMP27]|uniref:helix-turn-helix domain-containing protein n=1 Tax=Clostridium sp. HMP27 TaxID=1487921 RepID=UPI000691E3C2|nr:helix-turn-helix domain-containing protein [Clostridium sp. HMP27]
MPEDKLIQFKGTIYENGYGLIAKKIMKDSSLTLSSKAIYAYLCSYAGNESSAFPSVKLIKHELGISKDTFYKYIKELIDKGYIVITQQRGEKGKFSHNVYSIEVSPRPKIPSPKTPDTDSPDTVTPEPVISDTTSNNTTNNNTTSNSSNCCSNKELKNQDVYKHYEICGFGLLNKMLIDLIDADVEIYSKQWVMEAMTEAVRQNKFKLSFVEGILRNWKRDGRNSKVKSEASKKEGNKNNGNDKQPSEPGVDESGIGFHF